MTSPFALTVTPDHWVTVPLWTLVRRVERSGRPETEPLSVYRDHGVIPTGSRDDNFNKPSEDLSAYKYVQPGDLVINKMKTWQGSLGVSDFEGIVSPAYYVCKLSKDFHPRFAHHLLRSRPLIARYGAASKGIRPNQWDLPFEEFQRIKVSLPPLDEQRRIASFVDGETSRLDRVLQLRERQSLALDERFEATLSDQVTQASGDSWKLSWVLRLLRDGTHTPPQRVLAGVPLLTAKNVRNDVVEFTEGDTFITADAADDLDRSVVAQPGDVLLSIKGARLGRPAVVPAGLPRFAFERNLALLRVRKEVCLPDWLYFCLMSRPLQDQISLGRTFSALPGIYLGALGQLMLPIPALDDQQRLVAALTDVRRDGAEVKKVIDEQVALLRERRTAVISAAVLGQLDPTTSAGVA